MMGITVREALRMPALKDAVLVAGEAGLDRLITSVNVMEVPDIARFVKEDELLLTTAYPIKDNPQAQANLIPMLVQRGLAALAITPVAQWLSDVPESMVRQADEMAFPLIRLPQEASFNEIINPILSEILNRQAAILLRNEEIHRSLSEIVLNGGGLTEIAQMLASVLKATVSIHDARMRLLAHFNPGTDEKGGRVPQEEEEPSAELLADASRLRALIGERTGQVRAALGGGDLATEFVVHPVTVAREDYAYIIVWQSRDRVGQSEWNAVERAATVVALEIAKRRAVLEVEKRFRSNFIEDLIHGKISSPTEAISRGELYGWDLSGGFVPLLVEVDDLHELRLGPEEDRNVAQALRRLWDALSAAVAVHSPASISVDMSDRLLVLYRAPDGRDALRLQSAAADLAGRLRNEAVAYRQARVSTGIGRYCKDILSIREGVSQARQALDVGRIVNGPGSVTHFDDLGVYRIVADAEHRPELGRFARDLLAGLLENDRRGGGELLQTIEVVSRCNWNLRLAARELFIHYNTLRYRLRRIAELTKTDLRSPEGRLNLQVAVKIMRVLKTL